MLHFGTVNKPLEMPKEGNWRTRCSRLHAVFYDPGVLSLETATSESRNRKEPPTSPLTPSLPPSLAFFLQPRKNAKELLAQAEARNRRFAAAILVQAHVRGSLARGRANIVRRLGELRMRALYADSMHGRSIATVVLRRHRRLRHP